MSIAYLNGRFLPLAEANVPVMDRGFLFGDSIYEVIPAYGGRCFRLAQHLDRLESSLVATGIPAPLTRAEWQALLERLVTEHGGGDQILYLQVTRGVAAAREHRFDPAMRPTVFAMSRPARAASAEAPAPIAAVLLEDIRWARCDIKTTALLGGVLLARAAREAGADEAILMRDGRVWEGASSNVFAVWQAVLYTAPLGPQVLAGITRDVVLELARAHGLDCREKALPAMAMAEVSEIWVSSSTRELVPVTQLDGRPVGTGEVGPVFRQVWDWYYRFRLKAGVADAP